MAKSKGAVVRICGVLVGSFVIVSLGLNVVLIGRQHYQKEEHAAGGQDLVAWQIHKAFKAAMRLNEGRLNELLKPYYRVGFSLSHSLQHKRYVTTMRPEAYPFDSGLPVFDIHLRNLSHDEQRRIFDAFRQLRADMEALGFNVTLSDQHFPTSLHLRSEMGGSSLANVVTDRTDVVEGVTIRAPAPSIVVDLSGQDLDAFPPESCRSVPLAEILLLGHNRLRTFPEEVLSGVRLRYLDLSHNRLDELPETISSISSLKSLNLDFNSICGFPRSIGLLSALEELSAEGNRIASVPDEFLALTNLTRLVLKGNPLDNNEKRRITSALPGCMIAF